VAVGVPSDQGYGSQDGSPEETRFIHPEALLFRPSGTKKLCLQRPETFAVNRDEGRPVGLVINGGQVRSEVETPPPRASTLAMPPRIEDESGAELCGSVQEPESQIGHRSRLFGDLISCNAELREQSGGITAKAHPRVPAKGPRVPGPAGTKKLKSTRRFVCPHCPKPQSYAYLWNLGRHVKRSHAGLTIAGYSVQQPSTDTVEAKHSEDHDCVDVSSREGTLNRQEVLLHPPGNRSPGQESSTIVLEDQTLSEEVARLKAKVAKLRRSAMIKRPIEPHVPEKSPGMQEARRFVCPHCFEHAISYTTLCSLKRHVSEIHVGRSIHGYRVLEASTQTLRPNRQLRWRLMADRKRWTCTLCGEELCWKDTLYGHVKKKHKELHLEFKEQSEDKKKCSFCIKSFNVLAGKMIHMAEVHALSDDHDEQGEACEEAIFVV
jgi:transcription elongation factor Elf1